MGGFFCFSSAAGIYEVLTSWGGDFFFGKSSKKYAIQTLGSRAFEKVCIAEVLSLLQVLTNFISGTLHYCKTKSCGIILPKQF